MKALWGKRFKKRILQILRCGSLLLCGKVSKFVWIYQPSCAYSSKFPCYSRLTIKNSWQMNIYGCLNSIHIVLTSMTKIINPMASYLFVTTRAIYSLLAQFPFCVGKMKEFLSKRGNCSKVGIFIVGKLKPALCPCGNVPKAPCALNRA